MSSYLDCSTLFCSLRALMATALLLLLGATTQAGQLVSASDNFDSYALNTNLNGGSGGTGDWAGNWAPASPATNWQTRIVTSPFTSGGNAVRVAFTGSGTSSQASLVRRDFDPTSESLAVALQVQLNFVSNSATSLDDDFIQFQVSDGATGNAAGSLSFGARTTSSGLRFFSRVGTNSNTTFGTQSIAGGGLYGLLAVFSRANGSTTYNRTTLYVTDLATGLQLGSPIVRTNASGTGLAQLDLFNVRTANLESADNVVFDGLTVYAVPEPSTLAMGGLATLALASLALTRRRRRD